MLGMLATARVLMTARPTRSMTSLTLSRHMASKNVLVKSPYWKNAPRVPARLSFASPFFMERRSTTPSLP